METIELDQDKMCGSSD